MMRMIARLLSTILASILFVYGTICVVNAFEQSRVDLLNSAAFFYGIAIFTIGLGIKEL